MKIIQGYFLAVVSLLMFLTLSAGCSHFGHYPVNVPLETYDPDYGYIPQNLGPESDSEELLLILSFSGGGTRAAAFSYGVLEELRATEVTLGGKKRFLSDEVDLISSVSGGSFTAGYFGLFGDKIFEDFEQRFLKKNIQWVLTSHIFFNPINWFRLSSPYFDRSDLAAEYYDKHVFDHGTFGDMINRKGPIVMINATDMSLGQRFTFHQTVFNAICSDLSKFHVARACAASSAVPGLLSAVTLRNYAGSCDYEMPPFLSGSAPSYRLREMREAHADLMNSEKKKYFHLIDGGVADNLGLRAIEESVELMGNTWTTLQYTGREAVRKIVFIIVNAETKIESIWDTIEYVPPFRTMLSSYSTIGIVRYNRETMAVLQESLDRWGRQIREGRCPPGKISKEPGSCGDIEFYLVEVRFQNHKDKEEADYLSGLPTAFRLSSEEVDRLRAAGRAILAESDDFRKLLMDLNAESLDNESRP